jgi:GAF domain-containing protein
MLAGSTLVEAKRQALTQARPALVDINSSRSGSAGSSTKSAGAKKSLVAPITLRDIPIGALQLHPLNDDQSWTDDDLAVIEAIVDELAQTAENLRLFEETRQQAGFERVASEITQKIRQAPTLDQLAKTAVEELSKALNASHSLIKLGESPATAEKNENGDSGSGPDPLWSESNGTANGR